MTGSARLDWMILFKGMDCRVKPGNDISRKLAGFICGRNEPGSALFACDPACLRQSESIGASLLRCEYASLILHPSSSF
jgi:hypothetical protein